MENTDNRKFFIIVATAVLTLILIYISRRVITPFFIAFSLAYLLDPLVDRLEDWKIPRTPGIVILMSLFFPLVFLASALVLPILRLQVEALAENLPDYIGIIQNMIRPLMEKFSAIDPGKTQEILNMGLKKFGELPLTILTSTTSFLWSSISSLVNILFMLFNLVIIPVAMFYLLRDFDEINKKLTDLIPPRFRNLFVEIFHEIDDVLSNFIRGQLMVATMMAVFYCIGLYFIGTPLSLLIGILAGFANLVPYLGLVFGLLPAALMTFLQYQEWLPVLQVALLFGGVQAVEGFLITPRVVGDKLGLHPVVVMLAVLLGAEFFGFLGIFLAVPVVAVFKVLVDRGLVRYKKSSVYS